MRDPFAPHVIVSITDPAIHWKTPKDRIDYDDKRGDLPPCKDGAKAVLFTVTPCPSAFAIAHLDSAPSGTRALLAFRACVHRIELPTGEVLEPKSPYDAAHGARMSEEEWVTVAAKAVGPRRIQEIGDAAYRLSMLDDIDPLLVQPGQPPQS